MARPLHILSGGAAQGLVRQLQPAFEAEYGCTIEATFGAVGAMRDKLVAGAPCDLLLLTDALVTELAGQGHAVGATARPVGVVRTGVALKLGTADPDIATPNALKQLLQDAPEIYFPDPAKATAGIHFMKVLHSLGLATPLAARLRTFPNGATAMAALAKSAHAGAVGCTQVTEILITPGVRLAGLLPPPYELATTYTGAVCSRATEASLAVHLLGALVAAEAAETRKKCGFE